MLTRSLQALSQVRYPAILSLLLPVSTAMAQQLVFDPGFDQGSGLAAPPFRPNGYCVLVDAAGHYVVGGRFASYNGTSRSGLIRVAPDGTLDNVFGSGTGPNDHVFALGRQSDGRLIIGGRITSFDGQSCSSLARLNLDGSLDGTFTPGVTWDVNDLVVLPNDDIVVCGRSQSPPASFVQRFDANGVLDAGFTVSLSGTPWEVEAQADGKILLGGAFSSVNSVTRFNLARLNTDGSTDLSFSPPYTNQNFQVRAIHVLPDGRILSAAPVSPSGNGLVRLLADGSIDPTFFTYTYGEPVSTGIQDVKRLPDGRLAIAGSLRGYGGTTTKQCALLNADGSLYAASPWGPDLPLPEESDGGVFGLDIDAQGRIVLAGVFQRFAGGEAKGLCRLSLCSGPAYFEDLDGDGIGNGQMPSCDQLTGYVTTTFDCDDDNPGVGGPVAWYMDADGDGFGAAGSDPVSSCVDIPGYVPNAQDCDDEDPTVFPDATCDDGDPYTTQDKIGPGCACQGVSVTLDVKVVLGAIYNTSNGLMDDGLRAAGLIPLTEPYTALGFLPNDVPGGGDSVDPSVFATTGPDAIVDWMMLVLRDPDPPYARRMARMVLLQRDADVVGLDGASLVKFPEVPGAYRLEIRHRNHLGIMTSILPETPSGTPIVADTRSPSFLCYGTFARRPFYTTFTVLWGGNTRLNGYLSYTGTANDRDPILLKVGAATPNNTVTGYHLEDVTMDGVVKYTGTGNDRDRILQNFPGHVNTVRIEQVP